MFEQSPYETEDQASAAPGRPLEVAPSELASHFPSLLAGAEAMRDVLASASPKNPENEDLIQETIAEQDDDSEKPVFGRKAIREIIGTYRPYFLRLIRSGSQLAASYEDPEEGTRIAKGILDESTDGVLTPIWDSRIEPAADALRKLRFASNSLQSEVETVAMDPAQRYTLLKAFAMNTDMSEEVERSAVNHASSQVLVTLHTLAKSPLMEQLSEEAREGTYDPMIAQDLVDYIEASPVVERDLDKIRQLGVFLSSFVGIGPDDRTAFFQQMAARVADWPADQRQIVINYRRNLIDGVDANKGQASQWLRERGFTNSTDMAGTFEASINALFAEFIKRVPTDGPQRAWVLHTRAQLNARTRPQKRSAKSKKESQQPAPTPEGPREPQRLVTCNLNDQSTTEGVEGIISNFLQKTNPGDTALKEDLDRMTQFMARTDLPTNFRRGIKPIRGAQVRFGDDGKLWEFFEFKPTEAAGLSLRTGTAKGSRIYFIKMAENTLGIIGLEPRSNHENFLKQIRVKAKIRG